MLGSLFYRSSLEYWTKATLDYNWYWLLAVFLGWTGLDMLYLRSPVMMIVKIFLNVFSLGYYWLYDAMEATFNQEQVKVAGPTMPFYGPIGLAGGMFRGTSVNSGSDMDKSKHYNYLLFGIVLAIAGIFGGDSFLVGDSFSGYFRIICLVSFIFAPIAFIWWIYKLYLYIIRQDQLLDQNYEYFGAPRPSDASARCPNVLEIMTAWSIDTASVVLSYIPIVGNFAPMLKTLANQLYDAYGIARQVVETGMEVQNLEPAIVSQMKLNPDELTPQMGENVGPVRAISGGAQEASSTLFLMVIGAIIVSGFSLTLWRTYQNGVNSTGTGKTEKNQSSGERSDDPPDPGHA